MQRVGKSLTKQANLGTGTHISLRSNSEFLYILSLRNQKTKAAKDRPPLIGAKNGAGVRG
jgi:hypothetical protein